MNEIDSFPINSKINLDSLDFNSYSDRYNYSEFDSNTNSEINMFSNINISFNSYEERNIDSESYIISKYYIPHTNFLNTKKENIELFDPSNSNKNSHSESEFNNIELINKKEDLSGKSKNNVSAKNIDIPNNFNIESNSRLSDNNEILNYKRENNFLDKKRKKIFFTQNEKDNDSITRTKTNGNKRHSKIYIPIENSNTNSEEEIQTKKDKNKKNKKSRKENSDNIFKKIKVRFNKDIKIRANEILESAGYILKFKYLPFADNLNKNFNTKTFNTSFKDLFSMDFEEFVKKNGVKNKIKDSERKNYEHNKSVLEYLERNNVNFDFLNMTYIQLFNDYLDSIEFEMAIDHLNKKEKKEYVNNYIVKANNFLKKFSK